MPLPSNARTAVLMTWSPLGTNWMKFIPENVNFPCFIRKLSARHQSKLRPAYIMTPVTPLKVAANKPVLPSRNYVTSPETVQTTKWSTRGLKVHKTTFSFVYPHWTKHFQFRNSFVDHKIRSIVTETRHIPLSQIKFQTRSPQSYNFDRSIQTYYMFECPKRQKQW